MPSNDSKPQAPPTIRDIARAAGFSHTTVSLCLRNHPSIPEATRKQVHEVADKLGYRSNVLVSALMTQVRLRHHSAAPEVVAFLTGGPHATEWQKHSASVGFLDGARKHAPKLGMRIEHFWMGEGGAKAASINRMLRARAIRGVLIAPFPKPIYRYELSWERLSCVGLGYAYNQHPLHRATHNHSHGARLAYRQLVSLGYQRIGLMLQDEENRRTNLGWLGGYLAEQHAQQGPPIPPLLTEQTSEDDAMALWMERHRPDAVIGFGPLQYRALERGGYAVPTRVAYAALDVMQMSLAKIESAAGIDQNLALVGATAVDKLATLLYHNKQGFADGPVLSMVEGVWTQGVSAPPVESRAQLGVTS